MKERKIETEDERERKGERAIERERGREEALIIATLPGLVL